MQARDQKPKPTPGRRNAARASLAHQWGVFVLTATVAMICCVGMIELAHSAGPALPSVGDIVAFRSGQTGVRDSDTHLMAERPGAGTCMLDVQAMRQSGGSLIVEERRPGPAPTFRVHWSGLRTAADAQNCGAAADLLLRASDLDILAMGAGGYGVPGRSRPFPAGWMHPAAPP